MSTFCLANYTPVLPAWLFSFVANPRYSRSGEDEIRVPSVGCLTSGASNWRQRRIRADHPVNCVDWKQAETFCAWQRKRLPSEQERAYAARGVDGRMYPWGWNLGASLACVATNETCPKGSSPQRSKPFWPIGYVGERAGVDIGKEMLAGGMPGNVLRVGGWESDPLAPALRLTVLERTTLSPAEYGPDIGFRCVGEP